MIYQSPVHDADCPASSLERKSFSVGLERVWSSQIRMRSSCLSFPCGFSHHKVIALAKNHELYHCFFSENQVMLFSKEVVCKGKTPKLASILIAILSIFHVRAPREWFVRLPFLLFAVCLMEEDGWAQIELTCVMKSPNRASELLSLPWWS